MQEPARPATGYPYPYPNPTQPAVANGYPPPHPGSAYPYQNPYYGPAQPNPRATFYRRLVVIFLSTLVIFGIILFIFFLVMRPRLPVFTVTSLSVSGFNVTNSQVSGTWNLQLQVRNPNKKMSLSYDDVGCWVTYGDSRLSDTRLPPFDQGTRDQRTINATLSVSATYVDAKVSNSIGKERAARGSVDFDVRLLSWVGYRYGAFRGRRRYLKVLCEDLRVGLPANGGSGKMNGPGKECKVY